MAITYTNVTTVADVKLILLDTGATDAKSFLTTKQYLQFILKHIAHEEQDWTISEIATNYFRYTPGGLYLFIPSATTGIFTGEDPLTYETTPDGTIYVSTGGNHAGGDITVTAASINKNDLMVDLCLFIAQHRAMEVPQAMGEGSYTPEEVYRKMVNMAEWWRGVR